MKINEIAKLAHHTAKEKGFWPTNSNIGEKLMLVTSELGEALEADSNEKYFQNLSFENYLSIEELSVDKDTLWKEAFENYVKDTFEDEIADAMIRLMDLAAFKNIDLEWHIENKMRYNAMREHMHGKKY